VSDLAGLGSGPGSRTSGKVDHSGSTTLQVQPQSNGNFKLTFQNTVKVFIGTVFHNLLEYVHNAHIFWWQEDSWQLIA
jgi:hypothetical protein